MSAPKITNSIPRSTVPLTHQASFQPRGFCGNHGVPQWEQASASCPPGFPQARHAIIGLPSVCVRDLVPFFPFVERPTLPRLHAEHLRCPLSFV
jgi:hypothetical protein